jgi:hypothetical protein
VKDNLRSNWTIEGLLTRLPAFRRVDDRGDGLAFRVAGVSPTRTAYVYLYGEDPDLIHYDLEDESVENGEWDHAVERGSVGSVEELCVVLQRWLRPVG